MGEDDKMDVAAKDSAGSSNGKESQRKGWLEILKVVGLPLVTLILGFMFNQSLNKRQEHDSRVRLYTEMMGRREQADSDLRKDMFKSILDTFMSKDPKLRPAERMDQAVLNLELLASNFHQSLDIAPLFKHVRKKIQDEGGANAEDYRTRLERVAQQVIWQQLTMLDDGGTVEYGDTPITKERLDNLQAYIAFGAHTVLSPDFRAGEGVSRLCLSMKSSDPDMTRHYRQFKLEVTEYDPKWREVRVRMYVSKLLDETECTRPDLDLAGNREIDTKFWVGLFDFPMIDNTHLSYGERCAVSVTNLNPWNSLRIAVAYFPDSRASLKDKPYYEDLIHELVEKGPASKTAAQ
jgi:hypothetical protein